MEKCEYNRPKHILADKCELFSGGNTVHLHLAKRLACALFLSICFSVSIGQMEEGNCNFSDGFEGGIKDPWINNGWKTDSSNSFAETANVQSESSLSILVKYPCDVSFRGMKRYPGSKLLFLDNNITMNNSCLIYASDINWRPFTQPIGEDYSIITSDYLHELRWYGIGAAWLDDVCISIKPYLRLDGKVTPNNCTSESNLIYTADIESNVPGVEVELVVVPPNIDDDLEKGLGAKKYENAQLKWGPEKLNWTNIGMGKFYFKIGPPFNTRSKIYEGPNFEIYVNITSEKIMENYFRHCLRVISNTTATIDFFETETGRLFDCRRVNSTKGKTERLCINSSYDYITLGINTGSSNHECTGG